jgi:DNA repair protein RadA/Sms
MLEKKFFACLTCGYQTPRWLGRCPACGGWNTLMEMVQNEKKAAGVRSNFAVSEKPCLLAEIPPGEGERFSTGISELDRVLSGGIVPGSLVLLGGDPGIGKSTLMLQLVAQASTVGKSSLYVSGEESVSQIYMRASRLKITRANVYVVSEINVNNIEEQIKALLPEIVIIDSIQTIINPELGFVPGSVNQIRECTIQLMRLAKATKTSIFLVGHVTKEGILAGPRLLEHIVDTVLYFEGEKYQSFRILRSLKNRFGSTNEIGIFEMREMGLEEVSDPSMFFLMYHHLETVIGAAVVPVLEGTRPLLVEIQALVTPTGYGAPRRMTAGVDYNRVALVLAVLEKRVGLQLNSYDTYVSAVGGVRVVEPAADLGIAMAVHRAFAILP